jgi:phosphatidate phosphatase APP1
MADARPWLSKLVKLAASVEDGVDAVRYGLRARLGANRGLHVATYRSYGTVERLRVAGRVLRDGAELPVGAEASTWANLLATYRRFETDEVPDARLRVTLGGAGAEVVTDREGYFDVELTPPYPVLPGEQIARVELLEPAAPTPVVAEATVLVPAATARFGVISDIDDTVVRTDVGDLVRLARSIFLGNAHTRLPFPGVAAFYRALRAGPGGACDNPLFYVSSSPWNLYELLDELFRLRDIPRGPLMLRDWGLSADELLPTRHAGHKRAAIARILETYPAMTFVLIGDSGQEDPEIYASVMRDYPGRVLAAYIRDVSLLDLRRDAIRTLADELLAGGATLVLTSDTLAAAEHAASRGWIERSTLAEIEADRER